VSAPQESRCRLLAPSPELAELLALRRVAAGGVALYHEARYLDRGNPMPDSHSDALDRATVAETVLAGALDSVHGCRRLRVTETGEVRLAELNQQFQVKRPPNVQGRSGSGARPATATATDPDAEVTGRAPAGVWAYHEDDERDHALNVYAVRSTWTPPIAKCGLVLAMRLLDPKDQRRCQACLTHIEIEEKLLAQAPMGEAAASAWDSGAATG
jgi:hypothetical protein